MSRKRIIYIAFFAGLVLVFFFAMSLVIPDFGKKKVKPLGTVQPFSFVNQDGQTVTERNMAGKVVAVEYFFTTCKGICPRLNKNLRKIYEAYKDQPDFMLLSHTSDPETDSASRLKRYADSLKVNTGQWVFVTGPKDSLYHMARHSYKIDDPANNLQSTEDDFLHTQFVALVNRKGEVVRIYDGLKGSEMDEMSREIQQLLNK